MRRGISRGFPCGVALALGVMALLGASAARAAEVVASAYVLIDGEQQFALELIRGEKEWIIPDQTLGSENDGWQVTVGGTLNPDPSIAYGLAVIDFGAPTSFGFFFFTPIVPTPSPTVVTGSIVGGLTDLTGDGVSITPFGQPLVQSSALYAGPVNMGVDVGPAFAAGPAAPGAFYGYGPHAAGPIPGPAGGPWVGMDIFASFTLSGGGDIAALTGFASVTAIPEPSTLALAGLSSLGLLGYGWRRRRQRS